MTRAALAVDLGGTELRAAIVDETGQILAHATTPTDATGGPDAVIDQIARLVATVRASEPGVEIAGLGIGAPGPLDTEAGISIAPPTLAGWQNVPLAARLQERLGIEVKLENDANAAALGEWRFGAGRGTRSMVFITVSTGIGGGVIADGRLLHGYRGLAGEIGHMTIAEGTERCYCGVLGCWEALASGTALAREAAKQIAAGNAPGLQEIVGAETPTARHVGQAARAGDRQALALVEAEARWLGIGLVNLLHLYSPERLIIGGGVSELLDLMQGTIDGVIQARAMSPYRDIPVVRAQLRHNAGLVGAASLVL
jgi:glucokinase